MIDSRKINKLYVSDDDLLTDIESIINGMGIYEYHNLIETLKARNDTEYHLNLLRNGKYHTHIMEYLKSKYRKDKRMLKNE